MTPVALRQLSERVYRLPGAVNTAIVLTERNGAVLIDTGGDKNYGRNIKRALGELGVSPVAIVNTHAHADHYGGNDYLLRHYDVPVYAPTFEAGIIQNPYLEPVYLFGGAKPPAELMSKWLFAKPSRVDHLLLPGSLELAGAALQVLDTSGHAHTHLSIMVDDVVLAADAVFGDEALAKYPLPFGQDIARQSASAQRLIELDARVVLPGHGEPSDDVAGLVTANLVAFRAAARAVTEACQGGDTATVMALSCEALGVESVDLPRYYLNLCTVMAYLSCLRESGRVELRLSGNRLTWHRC